MLSSNNHDAIYPTNHNTCFLCLALMTMPIRIVILRELDLSFSTSYQVNDSFSTGMILQTIRLRFQTCGVFRHCFTKEWYSMRFVKMQRVGLVQPRNTRLCRNDIFSLSLL